METAGQVASARELLFRVYLRLEEVSEAARVKVALCIASGHSEYISAGYFKNFETSARTCYALKYFRLVGYACIVGTYCAVNVFIIERRFRFSSSVSLSGNGSGSSIDHLRSPVFQNCSYGTLVAGPSERQVLVQVVESKPTVFRPRLFHEVIDLQSSSRCTMRFLVNMGRMSL